MDKLLRSIQHICSIDIDDLLTVDDEYVFFTVCFNWALSLS